MRQIKFRGQRIDNGEWVYGYLYQLPLPSGVGCMILTTDNTHEDNSIEPEYHLAFTLWVDLFLVKPETVGQLTDLQDKKDQEIYEGDILFVEFADKSGGKQLVGWNEETASWGIMSTYEYQSLKEGDDWPEFKNHTLLGFLKHAIICEVVGNIHDNPELMNVPNKE